jgi:hypothetical protein
MWKGKFVPVLYWTPRLKTFSESGGIASRPVRFTPRERARSAHWIGGLVGPRADLDAVVKRKIPSSRRESNPKNPDRAARSLVAISTELSRLCYLIHLLRLRN